MKKKSYEERFLELQEFEKATLRRFREEFKEESAQLAKKGLALDIDLHYFKNETDDDSFFERPPMSDRYLCDITITIRRETDPYRDLDKEYWMSGRRITRIVPFFWYPKRLAFGCCPDKYLRKFVKYNKKEIKKILDLGYEQVVKI